MGWLGICKIIYCALPQAARKIRTENKKRRIKTKIEKGKIIITLDTEEKKALRFVPGRKFFNKSNLFYVRIVNNSDFFCVEGARRRQIPAMDDPGANFDFSQIPGAAKLRAASCAGYQILSELDKLGRRQNLTLS